MLTSPFSSIGQSTISLRSNREVYFVGKIAEVVTVPITEAARAGADIAKNVGNTMTEVGGKISGSVVDLLREGGNQIMQTTGEGVRAVISTSQKYAEAGAQRLAAASDAAKQNGDTRSLPIRAAEGTAQWVGNTIDRVTEGLEEVTMGAVGEDDPSLAREVVNWPLENLQTVTAQSRNMISAIFALGSLDHKTRNEAWQTLVRNNPATMFRDVVLTNPVNAASRTLKAVKRTTSGLAQIVVSPLGSLRGDNNNTDPPPPRG